MQFDFAGLALAPAPAWLHHEAARIGVEFDSHDVEKLGLFLAALLKANQRANLTSITDAETAWKRHILDSLSLMGVLADLPEGARVLDVGSGGGLPGIPLAICMPGHRVTLLEATGKKCDFLRAAIRLLGLVNVTVLQGRAEVLAHDRGRRDSSGPRTAGHREAYDVVVARAVGRLNILAELTVPFARVGGIVALIKGAQAAQESEEAGEALRQLKVVVLEPVLTPFNTILVLEKNSATPKTYPRGDGEPARAPLGARKGAR